MKTAELVEKKKFVQFLYCFIILKKNTDTFSSYQLQ